VRPSLGAWLDYGLGTENTDLPGFVSLSPSLGNGGPRNHGTAFLPPIHQGTPIGRAGLPARESGIRNLVPPRGGPLAAAGRELLAGIGAAQAAARPGDAELEAVIAAGELAARMESVAPGVLDPADETAETLALYGIDGGPADNFGRQCLLARRLCEAGVRFVQVNYTDNSNNPAWDQHSDMPKHALHARATDRPVAALIRDLKRRGLLDDTIVWWGSEFGRTPYAQENGTGRDHNIDGFTCWLAGAGVKRGFSFGATDELGWKAVSDRRTLYDFNATILHLLGLDHERLSFPVSGTERRLTDVHGHVIREVLS
jgi:hypothetical protein